MGNLGKWGTKAWKSVTGAGAAEKAQVAADQAAAAAKAQAQADAQKARDQQAKWEEEQKALEGERAAREARNQAAQKALADLAAQNIEAQKAQTEALKSLTDKSKQGADTIPDEDGEDARAARRGAVKKAVSTSSSATTRLARPLGGVLGEGAAALLGGQGSKLGDYTQAAVRRGSRVMTG